MKNNLLKKGLVIGIICILLFIIPVTLGYGSKLEKNIRGVETQNINQYNGKPDLVCIKIGYGYTGFAVKFKLYVLNKGDEAITGWRMNIVKLFVKTRFSQKIVYEDSHWITNTDPHLPGGIDSFYFVPVPDRWGVYRCFFEVAPDQQWDESNYSNNKVWAYFSIEPMCTPRQLTELKFWKTGNEGLKRDRNISENKAINNNLFLWFLEHFPMLERLLSIIK